MANELQILEVRDDLDPRLDSVEVGHLRSPSLLADCGSELYGVAFDDVVCYSRQMLIDGLRFCDVCDELIVKDTPYAVSTVPQKNALLFRSLIENADDPPSYAVDADGNVRLEICLDCKMNMGTLNTMVN